MTTYLTIMAAVTLIDVAGSTSSSTPSSFTSSPAVRFDLISLPDPSSCGGDNNNNNDDGTPSKSSSLSTIPRDYILVSNKSIIDIHEVQIIKANTGKYASYFIGSRIIGLNPNLHISTRVDPLFFVIAHFHRQAINNGTSSSNKQWLPWEQALAELSPHVLQALNVDLSSSSLDIDNACGQLKHLLEVSDYGDELLLCRFDNDKALNWLVQKFNKAKDAMSRRLLEKKRRNVASIKRNTESGAFSSSFTVEAEEVGPSVVVDKDCKGGEKENVVAEEEATLTKEEELYIRVGALQLICEYLPTEWRVTLTKEVGLTNAQWMGKKYKMSNTSSITNEGEEEKEEEEECIGEKRSRSAWEGSIGQEDADALLQYTQGIGAGKAASVTPGEMKKKELYNAQSVGLKKLAKVNTKGMKSLSSFFGAGTKKVKK